MEVAREEAERRQLETETFRQMSEIVGRVHAPSSAIYWADFVAALVVAYGSAALFLVAPAWGVPAWAAVTAWIVSGFALFRVGAFIHEIQHFRRGEMRAFKGVWNAVYGVPFLMPSFMYEHHADHHSLRTYGTPADGEYLPLGRGSLRGLVLYLLEIPVLPLFAALRFGIGVPLSFASRRVRRWLMERASCYGINLAQRRKLPDSALYGESALADAGGFAVVTTVAVLLATGVLPWDCLLRIYLLATLALGLNWIRTLFAHRYVRGEEAGSRLDQLRDSVTVSGRAWWTELLFPVGLRYHSLHHVFPTLPYHALGLAHRRLVEALPADAVYWETVYPNVWTVWSELWGRIRGSERAQSTRS